MIVVSHSLSTIIAPQPLRVPAPVALWANFADPLDVITLDTTLADDFNAGPESSTPGSTTPHPTTTTPVDSCVPLRSAPG